MSVSKLIPTPLRSEMNSLSDITILFFLFGSLAICLAVHAQTGEQNDNHQHRASGLENFLKPLHAPESIGNGQNSGSFSPNFEIRKQRDYGSFQNSGHSYSGGDYTPNYYQGTSSYNNNGFQNMPPNNAGGYRYDNPSEYEYGSHHFDDSKNTAYGSGYQKSSIHKLSSPVIENHKGGLTQGQSSNFGYNYDAPTQNYYGNFQPASKETGYSYNQPKQPPNFNSNFKGHPYLPGISSSHNGYQYEQKQGFQGHLATGGYQYESPKHSGYNYYKPQQSSFKGQLLLQKPTTAVSSHLKESSSQGYSYDKPSTSFKEGSYSPLTSGW